MEGGGGKRRARKHEASNEYRKASLLLTYWQIYITDRSRFRQSQTGMARRLDADKTITLRTLSSLKVLSSPFNQQGIANITQLYSGELRLRNDNVTCSNAVSFPEMLSLFPCFLLRMRNVGINPHHFSLYMLPLG